MKDIKKITLTLFVSAVCIISNAQSIDNFGVRIGGGFANQHWEYLNSENSYEGWREAKFGFEVYAIAEKKFNKYISIRPEVGYIQKGFITDFSMQSINGEVIHTYDNHIRLHNLSVNIGAKIKPIDTKFKPYLTFGFRGDYLMSYEGFEINYQGYTYNYFDKIFDDYERIILSGIIGVGFEYNDLLFIDFYFNPAISKSFSDTEVLLKDSYSGMTLGLNNNKLINKDK
jgi:hypothetical protein